MFDLFERCHIDDEGVKRLDNLCHPRNPSKRFLEIYQKEIIKIFESLPPREEYKFQQIRGLTIFPFIENAPENGKINLSKCAYGICINKEENFGVRIEIPFQRNTEKAFEFYKKIKKCKDSLPRSKPFDYDFKPKHIRILDPAEDFGSKSELTPDQENKIYFGFHGVDAPINEIESNLKKFRKE